jgi:hypothetical protein
MLDHVLSIIHKTTLLLWALTNDVSRPPLTLQNNDGNPRISFSGRCYEDILAQKWIESNVTSVLDHYGFTTPSCWLRAARLVPQPSSKSRYVLATLSALNVDDANRNNDEEFYYLQNVIICKIYGNYHRCIFHECQLRARIQTTHTTITTTTKLQSTSIRHEYNFTARLRNDDCFIGFNRRPAIARGRG